MMRQFSSPEAASSRVLIRDNANSTPVIPEAHLAPEDDDGGGHNVAAATLTPPHTQASKEQQKQAVAGGAAAAWEKRVTVQVSA